MKKLRCVNEKSKGLKRFYIPVLYIHISTDKFYGRTKILKTKSNHAKVKLHHVLNLCLIFNSLSTDFHVKFPVTFILYVSHHCGFDFNLIAKTFLDLLI